MVGVNEGCSGRFFYTRAGSDLLYLKEAIRVLADGYAVLQPMSAANLRPLRCLNHRTDHLERGTLMHWCEFVDILV